MELKSFKEFLREEYLVLESIRHLDDRVFRPFLDGKYDMTPAELKAWRNRQSLIKEDDDKYWLENDAEVKLIETDKRLDTVFDALDRGRLLPSGIIPANTEFDSIRQVSRLVESAKSEIVIIDPYADATILDVLSGKGTGVTVRLVCKNRGKPTASEIAKFNTQYKGLTVSYSDDFHDRFVIIDNAELHNFGSSVNSLGQRVTTYSTRNAKEIKKLLSQLL